MREITYMVEYDFINTEHGYRPERIQEFKNRKEAENFAAATAGSKLIPVVWES